MIGKLRGIVDKIFDEQMIVDVNGVGYLVACSTNTLSKIGNSGSEVTLYIETVVREDAINLFGFADEQEKAWFSLLTQKVNGVGAKMAISILSTFTPKDLAVAISSGDKTMLKQASGVGPKLAERIIIELKDVAGKQFFDNVVTIKAGAGSETKQENSSYMHDAAAALEKLGFGRAEAFTAVNKIIAEKGELPIEGLVKEGLKRLANYK